MAKVLNRIYEEEKKAGVLNEDKDVKAILLYEICTAVQKAEICKEVENETAEVLYETFQEEVPINLYRKDNYKIEEVVYVR